MKKTAQLMAEALILLVLVVCIAFAGGYQINEQGARATGMGGAFVARASDPSAIYYNPAGLATQKGINALAGVDLIIPSTTLKMTGSPDISTESQVFVPVNLYGSYQVDDDIVVGLGVFNPFGLGTKWPSTLGSMNSSIQTWYINPSVAYKIDDQWSVGLGISYVAASAKITSSLSSFDNATGSGFNVNIGGIYKPMPELSIGLSYRIKTDIEFSGDAKNFPAAGINGTAKATIPMPGNLVVGAAYQVMPELTVEGDIQYVQWSAYDKLSIKINNLTVDEPQKWDDALTLRAGAEYKLDQDITLRGGLILDLSPQPPSMTNLMLPDSYRSDISIGGSYKIDNNLSIDAAYMLVLFGERDATKATPSGKYNSTAHVISLDIAYAF